jgi:hypothetical protein
MLAVIARLLLFLREIFIAVSTPRYIPRQSVGLPGSSLAQYLAAINSRARR